MAHDVFISFSHKDKVMADAICARLERGGVRCWYAARDIPPGADWAGSIVDAIKAARVLVLVFTDFSNASPQVLREVNTAVSAGATIIPFKLTENLPSQGMEYYLSTVHWLDAMNRPLEQSLDHLNDHVQAILGGAAAPVGATPEMPSLPEKKRKWWIPAAIAVLLALAVGIYAATAGRGRAAPESTETPAPAEITEPQTPEDDEEDEEAAPALQVIEVPASGDMRIADPSNTGTMGNLQCNYQNGGYACSDGEWFYYRSNDGFSLYKMRLDGSDKTRLNEMDSSYIGVVDGYLYYEVYGEDSGIYRMNTDGGERTNLFRGHPGYMCIVDGRIFFKNGTDGLNLYSMELDGRDLRCENTLGNLYYLTFWDGKIYWANREDGDALYRANYDGSDMVRLTEHAVDSLVVADGWLFYNDLNDHYLHMLNLETLETVKLLDNGIYDPTVSEYGIIGGSSLDRLYLYRSALGTSGGDVIADVPVNGTAVAEGYIFFENKDDHQLYLTDIYGDQIILL